MEKRRWERSNARELSLLHRKRSHVFTNQQSGIICILLRILDITTKILTNVKRKSLQWEWDW